MSNEHKEQARNIIGNVKNYECEWNGISRGAFKSLSIRIASALSSRDTEVREVLEGLVTTVIGGENCWCPDPFSADEELHDVHCLATRALYAKLQPPEKSLPGE